MAVLTRRTQSVYRSRSRSDAPDAHPLHVRRSAFWMALPMIVLLIIFSLLPFLFLLALSVTDSGLGVNRLLREFNGLDNFRRALEDITFGTSIINTVVYAFAAAILELVIGFALAHFFYRSMKGGKYLRTLALFPFITPPVAVAMIWRLIYEPNAGLINHYLGVLGLSSDPIAFLGTPGLALISLIVVDVWQWTPFVFLLALAALQALSNEPYEAAAVDGASRSQMLWHLTVPMVAPAMIVIFMIRLIGAFKIFDMIYMLTQGGPGRSTQVVSYYIQRVAFDQNKPGYAAALTLILLVLLFVIVTLLTVFRDRVRTRFGD